MTRPRSRRPWGRTPPGPSPRRARLLLIPKFLANVCEANKGLAELKALSTKNYAALAGEGKSLYAVFDALFPLVDPTALGKALVHFNRALDEHKHHADDCYGPRGGAPGCGCTTKGFRFVKKLAFVTDERKLAAFFASVDAVLLAENLRSEAPAALARTLALKLEALTRCASHNPAARTGKGKRARAGGASTGGSSSRMPRSGEAGPSRPGTSTPERAERRKALDEVRDAAQACTRVTLRPAHPTRNRTP